MASTANSVIVRPQPFEQLQPGFPQFRKFPLEIQRSIWAIGVESLHEPFISLDYYKDGYDDFSWYACHIRIPWRRFPVLWSVCKESRLAVMKFCTFRMSLYPWVVDIVPHFAGSEADYGDIFGKAPCEIDNNCEDMGKRLFWRPDRDVVFLQEKEREEGSPEWCSEHAVCRADPALRFYVCDSRLRFTAMFKDLFLELLRGYRKPWEMQEFEVVFVLCDDWVRKHAKMRLEGITEEDVIEALDMEMKSWQQDWQTEIDSKAVDMSTENVSKATESSMQVVAVSSLNEITAFVDSRLSKSS